jgi:hypothetical protein
VPFREGIVEVVVDGEHHTGLLLPSCTPNVQGCPSVAPALVFTSGDWVQLDTDPAAVTLRRHNSGGSVGRTVEHVNDRTGTDAVILQSDGWSGAAALPIDTAPLASFEGHAFDCFEFAANSSGTVLKATTVTVSVVGASLKAIGSTLHARDTGAVCIDRSSAKVVGMVAAVDVDASGRATAAWIHRYAPLQEWFDGMRTLAAVRSHSAATQLALYHQPSATTKRCLSVPYNLGDGVDAAAGCTTDLWPEERFWLDTSLDPDRPRLVSEYTGRCVELAGSTSGTDAVQRPCGTTGAQRFDFTLWPSGGGLRFRNSAGLCLGVEADGDVEQRSCTGTSDQRWFIRWPY